MLFKAVSLFAMATAVCAEYSAFTPAPIITDSPAGASYLATLPKKNGSSLTGSISACSAPDGKGVRFSASFAGLPAEGGPFIYHIHAKPVPSDGNCTGTAAHLDPYKRGEAPSCDASKPETCQTGDLSGKHGNITTQSWSQEYIDLYTSTNKNSPSYFGNLSFVIHLANKTRIGCANFTLQPDTGYPSVNTTSGKPQNASATAGASQTSKPSSSPASSASSAPPAQYSGNAASHIVGGSAAFLAAAFALIL